MHQGAQADSEPHDHALAVAASVLAIEYRWQWLETAVGYRSSTLQGIMGSYLDAPAPPEDPVERAYWSAGAALNNLLAEAAGYYWPEWEGHYTDRRERSIATARDVLALLGSSDAASPDTALAIDESQAYRIAAALDRSFGLGTRGEIEELIEVQLPDVQAVARAVCVAFRRPPVTNEWALDELALAYHAATAEYDGDMNRENRDLVFSLVGTMLTGYKAALRDGVPHEWAVAAGEVDYLHQHFMMDMSGMTLAQFDRADNVAWDHPSEIADETVRAYLRARADGQGEDEARNTAASAYEAAFARFRSDDTWEPKESREIVAALITAYATT